LGYAALTKVHGDKVKLLLNSLQLLKKEKAALESLGKEHKRSKLIEQLNKEILDQDLVIEVLRKNIYDEKGRDKGRELCDSIIVKALTKGPDRIRPLTREELRMEIDRLKAQGVVQEGKLKGTKIKNNDSDGDASEISSVSSRSFVNQGEEAFARVR
jgi:DNA mismatch repair ATPase MutS